MAEGIRLAIVGATGAVGQEMMKVLEEREFKVKEMICLADPREEGNTVEFCGESIKVKAANAAAFKQADIALFAVNADISRALAPFARENNCLVIDNSSAFRLEEGVPLVVPEVNPGDIADHQGVIANPNCSTTIMVVALNPIHQAFRLKRVIVSTYQAVSGAGIAGIDELERHTRNYLAGDNIVPEIFQYPIAFNLIPHIDDFLPDNYTREEMKLVWETRKIMHLPDLKISATAVRVPVFRSHAESITVETELPLKAEEAREIFSRAPGLLLQDQPEKLEYPMPLYAANKDEVYVGRVREDISSDKGLVFWVVSDQIRKGAATNAIQIAEIAVKNNLY